MHQKPFGVWALPGPTWGAKALPRLYSHNMWPTFKGRGGRKGKGEKGEAPGLNQTFWLCHCLVLSFLFVYFTGLLILTGGRELLEFLGVSQLSQTDDVDANQLIALLKMKDEELQAILSTGLTQ